MASKLSRAEVAPGSVVTMSNVSFAYPGTTPIIRSLDLEIERGRIVVVLGPNGSGKTTLLKLLTGAVTPSSGTVRVSEPIGFVPQLATTAFAYAVLDMVLMGRVRHVGTFGVPSRGDEAVALAALERVDMTAFASRAFDTLSGGERQLVMFARALASDARLLVFDEPMASLDLGHQRVVLQTIRRLVRDDGMTAVFTTHQPEHALAIADTAVLVSRSGPIRRGTAQQMLTAENVEELLGIRMRRARLEDAGASTDADAHDRRDVLVPDWES